MFRKKFSKPPVKVACHSCRQSKIRCDGQNPCMTCITKCNECSYSPSKRGGPRKKRLQNGASTSIRPSQTDAEHLDPLSVPHCDEATVMFESIQLLSRSCAGLRGLDPPKNIICSPENSISVESEKCEVPLNAILTPPYDNTQCLVRTYGNESDILNAYYGFIHDYFPILPPRVSQPAVDQLLTIPGLCTVFQPDIPLMLYHPVSPLSLAVSAILALIPHPDDHEPLSEESILRRRANASRFAALASARVESDCDFEASSNPAKALSSQPLKITRRRFHDHTPVDLESLLALLVLSVYEYAQRGSLLKMKTRASQALAIAMEKSLHRYVVDDEDAESKRQAWWTTVRMPHLVYVQLVAFLTNCVSTTASPKVQLLARQ